jgi:hypothetical protein
MNIWWCNQGRFWSFERPAGVVRSRDGGKRTWRFRKTVGDAKTGDIIVHYRRNRKNIVAFSVAQEDGHRDEALPDDYGKGWEFKSQYYDLKKPIPRDSVSQELLALNSFGHCPIQKDGKVKQVYFFPFDEAGLRVVLKHLNEEVPAWIPRL